MFATYNRYGERSGRDVAKDIDVWEFADHGGGLGFQVQRQLRFLERLGLR